MISKTLLQSVKSYIDEIYVSELLLEEFSCQRRRREPFNSGEISSMPLQPTMVKEESMVFGEQHLEELLRETDAGFSETLLKLIDAAGKKDSEIYKKANVNRKLFSKIRSNPEYRPSKSTALALAMALELSLDETKDLIARAGYALSHSSKFDIIVEYFILQENYDLSELNEVLFAFDQPLMG